jgi:hypothetical protein
MAATTGTFKESNLNSSISVLLPVHNAQATLAADVAKVLELLPDVTPRFDVLIVDDGSTDATYEIAHELTIQYPQVRMLRNAKRRGQEAALIRGLEETSAEVVLGHVGGQRLDAKEIEKMLGTLGSALPSRGNRLLSSGANRGTPRFEPQRIESHSLPVPPALDKARDASSGQAVRPSRLISWLERRGFSPVAQATWNGCFRVLRGQAGQALELPIPSLGVGRRRDPATSDQRTGGSTKLGSLSIPPRPNFLTRLKDFALGE